MIAYASRHLTRREQNYCTTRKELLTVVFYIRYFRCYLLGNDGPFRLRTDYAAILWLRRIPEPVGQQARSLEILEEFDFSVKHRPGRLHGNADAFSRDPCYNRRCCKPEATDEGRERTCRANGQVAAIRRQLTTDEEGVANQRDADDTIGDAQREDADIGRIYRIVSDGRSKPDCDAVASHSEVTKSFWRQFERLIKRDGILLRIFESSDRRDQHTQIVLPKSMRIDFLCEVHAGVGGGHLGRTRTEAAVRLRAYWPGWSKT